MSFNSISIKKFRSIASVEVNNLKQINVFVGENNCGKTSILEAIFILSGPTNPRLPFATNALREYKKFGEDFFTTLFYQMNSNNSIELFCINKTERKLIINPIFEGQNENDSISPLDNSGINNQKQAIIGLSFRLNRKGQENEIISELVIKGEKLTANRKDAETSKYEELIKAMFLNSTVILQDLSTRVSEIIRKKQKSKIIAVLQKLEPSIKDLHTEDDTVFLDTGLSEFIPLNAAGDGLKKLLSYITAIFRQENGILLVDEIDNGFHYSAQVALWRAIIVAAKEFNVQIFATTHSYENVAALYEAVQIETSEHSEPQSEDLISVYRVDKKTDKHIAHHFSQELLLTALENNLEIR